jgi:hypothetical protein
VTGARTATDDADFTWTTVRLTANLLIWAAHFGVIYAGSALVCARGGLDASLLGVGVLTWIIGLATLAALAGVLWVGAAAIREIRCGRHPHGSTPWFLNWVSAGLGGLAVVAIVWEAVPLFIVPPCA